MHDHGHLTVSIMSGVSAVSHLGVPNGVPLLSHYWHLTEHASGTCWFVWCN